METGRYLRHSMIDWFDQDQISSLKVIVIGAGAVGNEVLKNLCLLGVGNIHIIDHDVIEIHNLTRSVLFGESDIGLQKAEAAAKRCKIIDPHLNISFSCTDLWWSLTISDLRKYHAVFCCVDNFEARLRLNQLCLIAKVDLYNIGIDSRYVGVERYPFSRNPHCSCYECSLPLSVYGKIQERYSCGWLKKRAFEEKKVPTTIITSSIAGAEAVSMFLHGSRESNLNSMCCYTDTISLNSGTHIVERKDGCPGCSSITPNIQYIKLNANNVEKSLLNLQVHQDMQINLSDKIIGKVKCAKCENTKYVNDLAEHYDDMLSYCENCGSISNQIEIIDRVSLSQFLAMFSTKKIPVKYFFFSIENMQYLVELEVS